MIPKKPSTSAQKRRTWQKMATTTANFANKKWTNYQTIWQTSTDFLNLERWCQSSLPCAPSFLYFPKPRCIAAVCWFLLRGRVLRPEDACQKRFSWFFYWIPKVQKRVNLVDLVRSFPTNIYYLHLFTNTCKIGCDTPENGPIKVCQKLAKS